MEWIVEECSSHGLPATIAFVAFTALMLAMQVHKMWKVWWASSIHSVSTSLSCQVLFDMLFVAKCVWSRASNRAISQSLSASILECMLEYVIIFLEAVCILIPLSLYKSPWHGKGRRIQASSATTTPRSGGKGEQDKKGRMAVQDEVAASGGAEKQAAKDLTHRLSSLQLLPPSPNALTRLKKDDSLDVLPSSVSSEEPAERKREESSNNAMMCDWNTKQQQVAELASALMAVREVMSASAPQASSSGGGGGGVHALGEVDVVWDTTYADVCIHFI
jgi:hypothetical protein